MQLNRGFGARLSKNYVAEIVEDSTIVLPDAVDIPLRITGHAPFDVYFDATALSIGGSTKPFHHAEYTWTFTDPDNKVWQYGPFANASQNTAKGPIAHHIWDTPGTHAWSVSVKRNLGVATRAGTIEVTNGFATDWAGTKTCLISKNAMFDCPGLTGDPSTATLTTWNQVVAKFNEIADAEPAGPVAILLDATVDEGWVNSLGTTANTGIRSAGGPCFIGKYTAAGINTGFNPRIVGSNTTPTLFRYGRSETDGTSVTWANFNRLTVRGVTLDGSGVTTMSIGYGTWPDSNCDYVFFYEMHLEQVNQSGFNCFQMATKSGGSRWWKGMTIANCTQTPKIPASGTTANSFGYPQAECLAIVGNQIDAAGDIPSTFTASHNLRIQQCNGALVAHNHFKHPGSTRHCIKVHSAEVLSWGANPGNGAGAFTASSTTNLGQGDYRRPFMWVQRGYGAVNDPPPIFRCVVGGTTGAIEPAWDLTVGSDTTDGAPGSAVTWRRVAAENVAPDVINFRSDGFGFGSNKLIVCDNVFEAPNTPQILGFGPQDNDDASYVEDVIIERNYFDGYTGNTASGQRAIMMWASKVSIRNNIFNMPNSRATGIVDCELRSYGGPGTEGGTHSCNDVEIYANTFAIEGTPVGSGGVYMVRCGSYGRNIKAWNNIFYVPGAYAYTKALNLGTGPAGATFEQSNNLLVTSEDVTLFVGPLTSPAGFAPSALSVAKAAGLDGLTLYTDIAAAARSVPQSVGAYH